MKYAEQAFRTIQNPAPTVIVHSLAQAEAALALQRPVTLLSAPGAALAAGVGWWQALVKAARAAHPHTACIDILDCADSPGMAMSALRLQQARLVLFDSVPGFDTVLRAAGKQGAIVLARAPAALDLALRRHFHHLDAYLSAADTKW